jgi:hypothetical protein
VNLLGRPYDLAGEGGQYSEILCLATDEAAGTAVRRLSPETLQETPRLATSNSLCFLMDSPALCKCKAVAFQIGHYHGKAGTLGSLSKTRNGAAQDTERSTGGPYYSPERFGRNTYDPP